MKVNIDYDTIVCATPKHPGDDDPNLYITIPIENVKLPERLLFKQGDKVRIPVVEVDKTEE